jgi:long-chain fatty acid transport protein
MMKSMVNFRVILAASVTWFVSGSAHADIFHYNNVLVGERAVGLGGAFTALADDASGLYYNPAGIAFAQSNDISGSGNAYYKKSTEYSNVVMEQDYTETASGMFAPFLGILNKLDRFVPGLVGAFAMYTSDTELLNQNDRWPVVNLGTVGTKSASIQGFHRVVQLRTTTSHIALGAGYRMSGRLSVGFGLRYTTISELSQDFQQSDSVIEDSASGTSTVTQLTKLYQNSRTSIEAKGLEPSFGVQMALGQSVSLGLSARKGAFVSQELTSATDALQTLQVNAAGAAVVTEVASAADGKSSNPLGKIPGEVRLGAAWFANPRLMACGDISYYDPATNSPTAYKRNAVLNYSAGAEYYVTPSVAMRGGFFTNNDSRPSLSTSKYTGGTNVDYKGGSLFAAYIQPNSQISLGAVVQSGAGKAQKVSGSTALTDVTSSITTFAFAATTSL